jgi:hypothetical protein
MLMTAWEQLGMKNPNMEPFTTVGLEWAIKYYKKMDQTCAYVVAMGEWTSLPFAYPLTI